MRNRQLIENTEQGFHAKNSEHSVVGINRNERFPAFVTSLGEDPPAADYGQDGKSNHCQAKEEED